MFALGFARFMLATAIWYRVARLLGVIAVLLKAASAKPRRSLGVFIEDRVVVVTRILLRVQDSRTPFKCNEFFWPPAFGMLRRICV